MENYHSRPNTEGKIICSLDQLRPIALSPMFARMFKTFIVKWILPRLDVKQYGIVIGRGTTHFLVDLFNYITEGTEKSCFYAQLCTIDITKASDFYTFLRLLYHYSHLFRSYSCMPDHLLWGFQ